ncbi:hypothetical protein FOA52_008468 [Chlamydomonas sp. UWO 241]|nr:hypothetical protein FOA52_008468 [Chlamydomonas sp. UWO 241]
MGVAILRARQEAGRARGAACMALLQIHLHRANVDLRSPTPGHARPSSCQYSQGTTCGLLQLALCSDPSYQVPHRLPNWHLRVGLLGVLGSLACWVHQLHRMLALLDDDQVTLVNLP